MKGEGKMENVKCKMMMWLAGLALAAAAAPTVTVTDVAFDADARKLTVAYTLSSPAIVTAEILTNGVPIGVISSLFVLVELQYEHGNIKGGHAGLT